MAIGKHQPGVSGVLDQPAARLHQTLLQAGQRPVLDLPRQHQPPPKVPSCRRSRSAIAGLHSSRAKSPRLIRHRSAHRSAHLTSRLRPPLNVWIPAHCLRSARILERAFPGKRSVAEGMTARNRLAPTPQLKACFIGRTRGVSITDLFLTWRPRRAEIIGVPSTLHSNTRKMPASKTEVLKKMNQR